MKKVLLAIISLDIFAIFNYAIYEKEQIKANGKILLLELEPLDPHSLKQRNYIRLRYIIERGLIYKTNKKHGHIVVLLNIDKVATFSRFHNGEPVAPDEKLLYFHNNYGELRIFPNSFMLQEGYAQLYQNAKYGAFKFDKSDNYLLVGLADDKHQIIQPN